MDWNSLIHDKMMELFRLYLIVGGMSAVVMKYLTTNNLQEVVKEQKSILEAYKKDIGKYWSRGGEVLPLEIKSGKDYTKHAALSHVLENEDYQISKAYVFHNGNVSRKGKVLYAPVYMLMFVKKEQELKNPIYKPDFSVLM